MMSPGGSPNGSYALFLAGTLVVSAAFYLSISFFFGVSVGLFFIFMLGQGHYVMAYLWSIPRYSTMAARQRWGNLAVWGALSTVFLLGVFVFRIVPYHIAVLTAILAAVFHNFRDYGFFFHALQNSQRSRKHSVALTALLGGGYSSVFFWRGLVHPDELTAILAGHIPNWLSLVLFSLAIFSTIAGLFYVWRSIVISRASRLLYSVGGLLIIAILAQIRLTDLFYIFATWHFVLWLAYIGVRTHRSQKTTAGHHAVSLLTFWQYSVKRYVLMTASLYALLVVSFLVGAHFGIFPTLENAVFESFLWGMPGFVMFSLTHILFTALPNAKSQFIAT
jgi:hypothetical protein